jgi:3'(2'), 5'-bisphosphate nucleotidase
VNRTEELSHMLRIAREASGVIERVYASDFTVDYKGPSDPVTQADREANALICKRLVETFGAIPIVAEESDESTFSDWVGASRVFFVDPLDGTLEFIAGNDDFVVMIGLVEEGRPVAGVVVAPALGVAWAGADKVPAVEISKAGDRRVLKVSSTTDVTSARAVVSRSHQSERLLRLVSELGIPLVVPRGSAGLKAAQVAAGLADLYFQPGVAGKRWDTCAPEAILAAAGGMATDAWGHPIDYSGPELVNDLGFLATNGKLHPKLVEQLKDLLLGPDSEP